MAIRGILGLDATRRENTIQLKISRELGWKMGRLVIAASGLVVLTFAIAFAHANVNCEWRYKCELVLETDPFICGKWAPEAEEICPPNEEPSVGDAVSFTTFKIIKAPCNPPYIQTRSGECRRKFF